MGASRYVQLVLAISRGIVQDQRLRRTVLGGVLGGALLLLALGAFPLAGWLERHVVFFLLYWGAVAWLTVLAMLMALFEILVTRRQAIRERRELVRELHRQGVHPEKRP